MSNSPFSDDGLIITNLKLAWGDTNFDLIKTHIPNIVQDAIQNAPFGAIQDPAGSAIGTGHKPGGGGASGAIYAKFKLKPIPNIPQGSSIFNSTTNIGKKILHSHSYVLSGNPTNETDRNIVIQNIKETYLNALIEFNNGKYNLEIVDKDILNLVPVSASIYGGTFVYNGHLHPSYTFVALIKAIDEAIKNGVPIPKLNIYYYDKTVKNYADDVKRILDNCI